MHVALLDIDLGTHRSQALDVLIDRPRADRTAARQRNPGFTRARHQRPQHEDRSAHGFHHLVGRHGAVQARSIQCHRIASADSRAFP